MKLEEGFLFKKSLNQFFCFSTSFKSSLAIVPFSIFSFIDDPLTQKWLS